MARRRTVITVAVCGAVFVATLGGVFYFSYLFISPRETTKMTVRWQSTGKPLRIQGCLLDSAGLPVAGQAVDVDTDFGPKGVTTDAQGRFAVDIGESAITGIVVRGVDTVDWPQGIGLNCSQGLDFEIRLKTSAPKPAPAP